VFARAVDLSLRLNTMTQEMRSFQYSRWRTPIEYAIGSMAEMRRFRPVLVSKSFRILAIMLSKFFFGFHSENLNFGHHAVASCLGHGTDFVFVDLQRRRAYCSGVWGPATRGSMGVQTKE